MHELILGCGFLGAWFLVAGPVYQAVLELRAEADEISRIRDSVLDMPPYEPVSAWWWLLPPVRLFLARRRRDSYQRAVVARMSDEDLAAFTGFVNKAVGWMLVGAGGFLIATKETYELVEGVEWPEGLFWVLLVVMLVLSIGFSVARSAQDRRVREARAAA